jgi:membrane protease YdiL (CAAX protease family)
MARYSLPVPHADEHHIPRWRRIIRDTVRHADEESVAYLAARAGKTDWRTIIVLTTTAVALTIQEYVFKGDHEHLDRVPGILHWLGLSRLAAGFKTHALSYDNWELTRLSYWAVGRLVTYVLLPLLVIRLVLREPLRGFGTSTRGCLHSVPVYGGMFALMFPAVLYFSHTASFQESYPFYELNTGEKLWPRFFVWELLYAMQFVSLEFFFRGFVLHGTRHRAGSMAIFVMMVPYCMIHFQKPMPETFGAIGAGIILGFMSLKTRSIWLGAALHIAVAWSMDFLALAQR